ncbi:hypothetical protein L21SP5_00132 [Salinivirga cyanobacteriivorans]|uniref:Uncharacterized protein n=1 Tax=Salinivirga cyanobacteriivorans TaxID=1307839 RepID=A0A0S2HV23_9BACT|nr:hypothetical protein [Salinivirga cyanobacteriivorans]ALO13814.1 hypothetical protein L21SP5_00132 [Salinivirga cyanobacteriivorans]
MKYIKKYSYLHTAFIGIPTGLAFLIGGIVYFYKAPMDVNDLKKIEGVIISAGLKTYYENNQKYSHFLVELDKYGVYKSVYGKHIEKLVNIPRDSFFNKDVDLWVSHNDDIIRQLQFDNQNIIKFTPRYWIGHVFLWFGLITLISSIIYVIKHPEDLTGKKKEKPKGEGK